MITYRKSKVEKDLEGKIRKAFIIKRVSILALIIFLIISLIGINKSFTSINPEKLLDKENIFLYRGSLILFTVVVGVMMEIIILIYNKEIKRFKKAIEVDKKFNEGKRLVILGIDEELAKSYLSIEKLVELFKKAGGEQRKVITNLIRENEGRNNVKIFLELIDYEEFKSGESFGVLQASNCADDFEEAYKVYVTSNHYDCEVSLMVSNCLDESIECMTIKELVKLGLNETLMEPISMELMIMPQINEIARGYLYSEGYRIIEDILDYYFDRIEENTSEFDMAVVLLKDAFKIVLEDCHKISALDAIENESLMGYKELILERKVEILEKRIKFLNNK